MKNKKGSILFFLLLVAIASWSQTPVSFTPGNVVVCRIGNGLSVLSFNGTVYPVFLDEYTPTGVKIQTIAMPTATNGTTHALALDPLSQSGLLTLSADQRYLALTGLNMSAGVIPSSTQASVISRTVALIKYDGTINTSTVLTDFGSYSELPSAITSTGTDIWVASYNSLGGIDSNTNIDTRGLRYTTVGATTSVQVENTITKLLGLQITNGQLYCSSALGTSLGNVGFGLPTTSGQGVATLPGVSTSSTDYQFVFFDENSSIAGADVLYVETSTGLQKYSLNSSGTWVSNGTITAGGLGSAIGLTGSLSNGIVTLFASVTGSNSSTYRGGQLVSLTDSTGYTTTANTFTGTPTVIVDLYANNPTTYPKNTYSFKGVELVPHANVLPVNLVDITSEEILNDVLINWNTATEINTHQFEVERSSNTIDFVTAGTVNAKGSNSSYQFTDVGIVGNVASTIPVLYYRLKMVDNDGSFTYSKIVSVNLNDDALKSLNAYPNPFTDAVAVKMSVAQAGNVELNITDLSGKIIKALSISIPMGLQTITIPGLGALEKGTYFLKASINGKVSTIKLIK